MKKLLLFIILTTFLASAQDNKLAIDSLKRNLNKGNSLEQFKTLTNLSKEYSSSNLNTSKNYSDDALRIARKLKNDTLIALSYNNIGNLYQYKSQLDSALIFHKKALNIRKIIKDSIGIADSYNNIGIVNDTKGNYLDALKCYFQALYYYDCKNDIAKQAMVNTNIGIVYKAHKQYDKAWFYYKKANQLYSTTNNDFGKTTSAGNLGCLLINFKKYKESLKYSEFAKQGYQKLGYERFMGYPISNIAFAYDSLHQFKKANENYITAIQLHLKYENAFEISESSNAYALCLIKQHRYEESIIQSKTGLFYANKANAAMLEMMSFKNLSTANANIGNYKLATYYANLYAKKKDSQFEIDKTKIIFELETKYQTAKKEKLLLENETKAKDKNILIFGILVFTLFIILISLLLYRQQRQKISQQKLEYKLKKEIAKVETQNKLQEQRLRISRDLHDNIGAQLTFIISSVDNIKYAFEITNEKLDNKLSTISSFAKETIVELRDTIWAMNSNQILFEDLEIRINNYIEKAREAKDEISFSFAIDPILKTQKLTSVQGMNMYRTIQEAVNNAIKYANASAISINAKQVENRTKITVLDNGLGFDLAAIQKGNGLQNMQKRIEEIGGEFQITSGSEGTKVEILLYNTVTIHFLEAEN